MADTAPFYTVDGNCVRIRIRLSPGAKSEGFGSIFVDGEGKAWLKASVRAVPEDGRANAGIIKLLAKFLGIAKSAVIHAGGQTSRMKVFEVPASAGILSQLKELEE